MKIEMTDDIETIPRRWKINAILDTFYEDEPDKCIITDKSLLWDWGADEPDLAKIKEAFPKFDSSMKDMYLWQLADAI